MFRSQAFGQQHVSFPFQPEPPIDSRFQRQESQIEMDNNDSLNMNGQQRKMNEKDGAGDSGENQMDRTKLIINYIPQFASEEELANIFSQAGQIESIRIMRDFRTGYSYGFGFVKYSKPEFAAKAIEAFNGLTFRNKRLKVSYSRPAGQDMKDSNLYITNLPKNVTEGDIAAMFGEFGEIVQKTILKDKITGLPRGVAFVRYAKTEEAQAAIAALDGKQLENAMLPLSIRVAEDHGRQKAHYLDYMNHVCLFNARGFKPCRGGIVAPCREIHMPRGNFAVRGNCLCSNFHCSRCTGMGAGDNLQQNSVFW